MTVPKLVYFDIKGRGMIIRLAFALGGVEFIDERVQFSEWAELKPKTIGGSLPYLQLDDNKIITETVACLDYAGYKGDLMYSIDDPYKQSRVREVVCLLLGMIDHIYPSQIEKDPTRKSKMRAELREDIIPKILTRVNYIVQVDGEAYCIGNKMTIADIVICDILYSFLKSGRLEGIPTDIADAYTYFNKIGDKIYSLPLVQRMYAKEKEI